jgi:hypothetical protein
MSFYDDPEQSYRRGYMQAAWDVIDEVGRLLPIGEQARLRAWFSMIEQWRAKNVAGLSKRNKDGSFDAKLYPPRYLPRPGRNTKR